MARRVNFNELSKEPEKKEYFNSTYSFSKVTGLRAVGDVAFIILLQPESYIFQTEVHTIRCKSKGKLGFKGIYDTKIKCKSFDADGNKSEEPALCCQLANELYQDAKAYKEKTGHEKKMLTTFSNQLIHMPLMVLGSSKKSKDEPATIQNLSIKTYEHAYLEMTRKNYMKEIYSAFVTQLQNSGDVDPDIEEEELQGIILKKLKNTIIKVTAVEADSPMISHQKSYSFIPFINKSIGHATQEYEDIVYFRKNTEIKNSNTEFLELFEKEVDGLVKDWEDDELQKYLVDDVKRQEDVEACKEVMEKQAAEPELKRPEKPAPEKPAPKKETVIDESEFDEPKVEVPKEVDVPNAAIEQLSEVDFGEDDFEFDEELGTDFVDD